MNLYVILSRDRGGQLTENLNRTKLNTYIYMYKEDVITAEECMNYLPLEITIFIRIISHYFEGSV
jgi:hypothetical protein